jgi:hypothetical protein
MPIVSVPETLPVTDPLLLVLEPDDGELLLHAVTASVAAAATLASAAHCRRRRVVLVLKTRRCMRSPLFVSGK